MRKPAFCIYAKTEVLISCRVNAKTKAQISCVVNAQPINAFVLRYMDSTIPLLPKPLVIICGYIYSSACVGPG